MFTIVYTSPASKRTVLSRISDCTDKGKPAARQGRKAVSLPELNDLRID